MMRIGVVGVAVAALLCGNGTVLPARAQTPATGAANSSVPLTLPAPDEQMKSLGKAQSWRMLAGTTIALFYVEEPKTAAGNQGKDADEPKYDPDAPVYNDEATARRKLEVIEEVYRQGQEILGVQPAPFLVPVYLFPTAKAQGKAFGVGSYAGAATQFQTVVCRDGNMQHLRQYLSHEMAHILVRHRIADPLPDFLHEGVAVWVQMQVLDMLPLPTPAPNGTAARVSVPLTTNKPLHSVAGMNSDKLDTSGVSVHAASFVQYVASTGATRLEGAARVQSFLQAASRAKGKPDARMRAASFAVLGKDLDAAEKEWRKRAPDQTGKKPGLPLGFANLDFASGLQNWRAASDADFVPMRRSEKGFTLALLPTTRTPYTNFGRFFQSANLTPYRGKRVQASVTVERATNDDDTRFNFIYWQSGNKSDALSALADQKPGAPATYFLTFDMPRDALAGDIGLLCLRPGTVRVLNFDMREVAPDTPLTPRNISLQQLEAKNGKRPAAKP